MSAEHKSSTVSWPDPFSLCKGRASEISCDKREEQRDNTQQTKANEDINYR